jgi:molecular chaperone HtpG
MSEADTKAKAEKSEKHEFQAEVSRLLHLMVHSIYSDREIFLRELISNASDACDKLRYVALTQPELIAGDADLKISIHVDAKAKTLTLSDNGIGMNHDDLVENLGTIARSGTAKFVGELSGDKARDVNLIGQFGVGFYSAFMVADKVQVSSRKAGEDKGWLWESDGLGAYTISESPKEAHGTTIILHMKDDAAEFIEPERLRRIIKTYSDHISQPIELYTAKDDKAEEAAETVNQGSALWTRPKSDITEQQYTEFYHHTAHAFDDPWMTLHYNAEGVQEYSVLLFVPGARPFDLFDPARKNRVKLYVKRVFITDDSEEILPGYLRFMRGIIDSQDLPLNISREMLQHNPVLARIRKGVTNKILAEFEKRATEDAEDYATFWENFGAVLKEGIYEDHDRRDQILKLARFHTSGAEALTSLEAYVSRMKEGQKSIYYITADTREAAKRSPQLEGFKARGLEVLLLTDPVDDFWLQMVPEFDGKSLKSVTKGGADLAELPKMDGNEARQEKKEAPAGMDALVAALKLALGDEVKDVRVSDRLTESPVCLVASEEGLDMHIQRLLKQHNQLPEASAPILEINPDHALIVKLARRATEDGAVEALRDSAHLLLDQARIIEGEAVPDPAALVRRMAAVMQQGLA